MSFFGALPPAKPVLLNAYLPGSGNLFAKFEIQNSEALFAKVTVRHSDAEDLFAEVIFRHTGSA